MKGNAAWFEIPSADFERAVRFYEAIFEMKLDRQNIGGDMAIFPSENNAATGAVVAPQEGYAPNSAGPVIYLDGGADLAPVLERAAKLGGKVAVPKTALPQGMGFFAHFHDCEGNRVGLHSMS
jgi:uncharacterized protein